MLNLIKNEIALFLNKKNVFLFLVGIIAVIALYRYQYIKAYQDYPQDRQQELQENIKDIETWAEAYQNRLERLKEEYPGDPATPEAELMANAWNTYSSFTYMLVRYWDKPEKNWDNIRTSETLLDNQLIPVAEQKVETGITNLYRNNQSDWNRRMLLQQAYEKAGVEVPVVKTIPTGAYVLNDGLSGISVIFMLAALLALLWNYDSWGADFEQSTYRTLFTLPYSRKALFLVRFIVRAGFSLIGIFLLYGELFLCGTIRFGGGFENYVIINTKAFHKFGFFETGWEALMDSDKAVSIGHAILWKVLLILLFVIVLIALVHFISFALKSQMGTLILLAAGMITVVTYTLLPRETLEAGYNVFLYFQAGNAADGSLGIGLPLMLPILGGCLVVILGLTAVWFEKREV